MAVSRICAGVWKLMVCWVTASRIKALILVYSRLLNTRLLNML